MDNKRLVLYVMKASSKSMHYHRPGNMASVYKVLQAALEQVLNLGATPQLINDTLQHSYMEVTINNFMLHYYTFRCIKLEVPLPFWVRALSDHIEVTKCSN